MGPNIFQPNFVRKLHQIQIPSAAISFHRRRTFLLRNREQIDPADKIRHFQRSRIESISYHSGLPNESTASARSYCPVDVPTLGGLTSRWSSLIKPDPNGPLCLIQRGVVTRTAKAAAWPAVRWLALNVPRSPVSPCFHQINSIAGSRDSLLALAHGVAACLLQHRMSLHAVWHGDSGDVGTFATDLWLNGFVWLIARRFAIRHRHALRRLMRERRIL